MIDHGRGETVDILVVPSSYGDAPADRADALDPANSAAFANPETDGAYILGGDQTIAMQVLADSPAESVMSDAYARGVVIGGTSAGAAVESRSMAAGYSADGYPQNGLERDAPLIWWGDDADTERGLSFGSTKTIYDQHFFQRGRFGRLLNLTAQSVDRGGGGGLLGVGDRLRHRRRRGRRQPADRRLRAVGSRCARLRDDRRRP